MAKPASLVKIFLNLEHLNPDLPKENHSPLMYNYLPFSDKEIGESINSNIKDFEDGVQYFISINNNIKKPKKKIDIMILNMYH